MLAAKCEPTATAIGPPPVGVLPSLCVLPASEMEGDGEPTPLPGSFFYRTLIFSISRAESQMVSPTSSMRTIIW